MSILKQLFDNNMILDFLEQGIFVKDMNLVYLFANKAYANLIDKNSCEIIGKNDYDFFSNDIAQKYIKNDSHLLKNKEVIETEEIIVINNEEKILRIIKKPIFLNNEIVGLIGIILNITKEKQEEIKYKKLHSGFLQAQALANIGHWELDLVKNNLYWSDEVYKIFGLEPQSFEVTYEAFLNHIHPDDIKLVNNNFMDSVKEKKGYYIEHRIIRKNGEIGFVEERCEHEFDSAGNPIKSIGTVHDITKRKLIENELIMISEVFEKMNGAVIITDSNKQILKVNNSFSDVTQYSFEDVKGKLPSIMNSECHDNIFYDLFWDKLNKNDKWEGDIIDRKKNGELFTAKVNIIALKNDDGILTNYIAIFNDISEKKEQENLIHNFAYYDSLTGLPNRMLFMERFISRMPAADRNNKKIALFFIDMDNFKNVNDTLGHMSGDKFLIKVAKIIKSTLREEDTVARFGGDEFTILLDDIDSNIDIVPIAEKIIDIFKKLIMIDGNELYSGASIGISIYPDDSNNYEELVKAADAAMYHVKESGKNNFQFYSKSMNEKRTQRLLIENDLRSAIDNNELFLEYQPQINLETKSVYGMEALVRWNHPTKGLIKPDEFIGISEETGKIIDIGWWVIKQAVLDTKKLHEERNFLIVSINISSKQLEDKNFVDNICSIVENIGVEKYYIDLEITESHIMNNIDKALSVLNQLHEKGFKLSIDDFGTGYSSLSYLKKLPAKTIKIDRSFVLDIDKDEDDKSIVSTIIVMARLLGKDVIAEGSETREHIEALRFLHCRKIQGYFFSKPIPIDKFTEFIRDFKCEYQSA